MPWKREEGALCYVSSEHCYQKPGVSWEKPEETEKQKAAVKDEQNFEQEVKVPKPIFFFFKLLTVLDYVELLGLWGLVIDPTSSLRPVFARLAPL